MSKQRVVIIGAGLTGLAAAVRLAGDGRFETVLLEREAQPGGLARSLRVGDFTTDLGPHRIYSENPEIMDFIRQVAAPSLISVPRTSHMYLRGGFLRYPPDPLEMARRMGLARLARFAASFALGRLRPAESPETYEALMRHAFGPALYDFLLQPYSAKTWKTNPAELHADTARTRISPGSLTGMIKGLLGPARAGKAISLKELYYVRGGTQALVGHLWDRAAAAGGVRLELDLAVRSLTLDEKGRAVAAIATDSTGATRTIDGDRFISTVPLPMLLTQFLPEAPALAAARAAAAGLRFLDLILVCLVVRRPRISRDNWLYFPEPRFIFNRAYEAKNFDPSLGPPDRSILCLEITHHPGDAAAREPDEALLATVREQISATGLFAPAEVEGGAVFRVPCAYPLYALDYHERLEAALAGLDRVGNVISCGRQGLFIHNNMDHSIAQGLAAGELLGQVAPGEESAAWHGGLERFKNIRIVD